MSTEETGSYAIDTLDDPEKELERLKKQGEMFKQLEVGILQKCGLQKDNKVLELGSGPGFISKILAEVACDGELISIDNDPALLEQLRRDLTNPPKGGAQAFEASADDIPVETNWSDFTYARFLLQHVPKPQAIVDEAFRATKPGALFCAVDSDDGLIVHYPEHTNISSFLKTAEDKQAAYGGDRFVGRKLFGMMNKAGFTNVKASIVTLTSSEIPFQALFNILFGYKSSLVGNREAMATLLSELSEESNKGDFLLSAGVFVVVGLKPAG